MASNNRPDGPSVEVLIQQRDKDRRQLADREAQVAALTARYGANPDPTLEKLAAALKLAEVATDPAPPPQLWENGSSSAEKPLPGDHLRAARRAEQTLRRRVHQAVDDFYRAAEHAWYPPRVENPKVRCRNRKCPSAEVRIPKYVGPPGDSRIELTHCQGCGGKLSNG